MICDRIKMFLEDSKIQITYAKKPGFVSCHSWGNMELPGTYFFLR